MAGAFNYPGLNPAHSLIGLRGKKSVLLWRQEILISQEEYGSATTPAINAIIVFNSTAGK